MKEEKDSEEKPAEKDESKEEDTKNKVSSQLSSSSSSLLFWVKVVVLETAADHGGVHRVLLDNLITQEQCQLFLELTKVSFMVLTKMNFIRYIMYYALTCKFELIPSTNYGCLKKHYVFILLELCRGRWISKEVTSHST